MDYIVLIYIHELITASDRIAHGLNFLAGNHVSKGLPIIVVLWVLWFVQREGDHIYRARIVGTVVASIFAITVGRLLAMLLPFRYRPLYAEDLGIDFSRFTQIEAYQDMSSMPSDHAVFFATLCLGIFLMHRLAGTLISLYCLVIVLTPRIVFGKHWPSDILVGALVGALLAWLIIPRLAALLERKSWMNLAGRYEYVVYPAIFFLTFQMATMFESMRSMLKFGLDVTRVLIQAAL